MNKFTMSHESAVDAMKQRDQLCQVLEDENNMEQIRALAKTLDIPTSGRTKKQLCGDISGTAYLFQDKPADIYMMGEFYGDQEGGHHCQNPLTGRKIQYGGAVHRKLVKQGIMQ